MMAWVNIGQFAVNVAIFVVLLATFLYARNAAIQAVVSLRFQRSAELARSLFSVVADRYLDRKFSATAAPKDVPGYGSAAVEKVREVKQVAHDGLKGDPEERLQEWTKNACVLGTWQNKLAFELSIALERMGLAIFCGGASALAVVRMAADEIIDDWIKCEALVADLRQQKAKGPKLEQPRPEGLEQKVPYKRRHAEWLFMFALIWMRKEFGEPRLFDGRRALRQVLEGEKYEARQIMKSFMAYTAAERDMLGDVTKRDISTVLRMSRFQLWWRLR